MRNIHRPEQTLSQASDISRFIRSYVEEIKNLGKKNSTSVTLMARWEPPPGNHVKINFDAAFNDLNR